MSAIRGRGSFILAAALLAALLLPATSQAIPWDRSGSVAPADTPPALQPDAQCLESYADDQPKGGPAIRFGIGPRLAGEVGSAQSIPLIAVDPVRRDAALRKLAGKKSFTVRLNRLFMKDGASGIRRFRRMARHYASLGFRVELQVRYHPSEAQNGNIRSWVAYVRRVVRSLGSVKGVTALQITNEVNLTFSQNTSDGYYDKARNALIQGVKAASHTARREGHPDLEIGFNYAWRFGDADDADFWRTLRSEGGRALRRSTDWIGIDLYPGTFVPSSFEIENYGDAFLEALAQMRECYMVIGGFGPGVPLRIEETGWPTGPGRSDSGQQTILRRFVNTAVRYRGTYGVSDFRWFGLRDNNSDGPDFQSHYGLLDDDYERKPAFGEYRRLLARFGAP